MNRSSGSALTTTTPFPSSSPTVRGHGSPTSRGRSTSTCCRRTPRSTSATDTLGSSRRRKAQMDRLTLTSRAFHNDQLGAFAAGPVRAHRQRHGAADEHRRRGSRDRDQDRAQVGLPRQGRPGRPRADHRLRTATSTGAPPPSSRSPPTRTPATTSAPSPLASRGRVRRPRRAARQRSRRAPSRSWSSRSRARRASCCRRTGYLAAAAEICRENNVLFIADEIQSGLGRTGKTFAASGRTSSPTCTSWARRWAAASTRSRPLPLTADVLGVFKPGEHGSTFGGNPLAAAIGSEVIAMLKTGEFQERSRGPRRPHARPAPCRGAVDRRRGPGSRLVGGRAAAPGSRVGAVPVRDV